MKSESVNCVVTSPPYYGLRDYGVDGQIGLEEHPTQYIAHMTMIFEQVMRVLKKDGTLWLNIGDSYSVGGRGAGTKKLTDKQHSNLGSVHLRKKIEDAGVIGRRWAKAPRGFKPKELLGIPWRLAFALQDAGWFLRQDIIWHKPNPMPESVRDRCTKAHEYIFLMSRSRRYFFDIDAIKEPAVCGWNNSKFHTGKTGVHQLGRAQKYREGKIVGRGSQGYASARGNDRANSGGFPNPAMTRQKRSVWSVPSKPFKGAHFATFPPALIEPCVLAGCPKGGIVLDPFAGAGTTGVVCKKHDRNFIGIELNPVYAKMAEERIKEVI